VEGSCEYSDEPSDSGATELVNAINYLSAILLTLQNTIKSPLGSVSSLEARNKVRS
jgi:hypothetical protein